MSEILVMVEPSREKAAVLSVKDKDGNDLCGSISVCASSDALTASARGNSDRDPLKPYGHTPLGVYDIWSIIPTGDGTELPEEEFGKNGALVLEPILGEAKAALYGGRFGYLFYGGKTDEQGLLRPTNGGLRVTDEDMAVILKEVSQLASDEDRPTLKIFKGEDSKAPPNLAKPAGIDAGDPHPIVSSYLADIQDGDLAGSFGATFIETIHDKTIWH